MSGSVNSESDESSVNSVVDDSLRAEYNSHLAKKYLNPKSLKSTNRGWKTEKEINELYGKVKCRNAFEDAKRAREVKIGRKITSLEYKVLPKAIRKLYLYAKENGGYEPTRSLWSIRVDLDDNKEYLFRNKSKSTNIPADYHKMKMIPLEDSFDYLMKMHLDYGHIGSRGLLEHVTEARVGCFLRKLILDFSQFCPQCSTSKKERDAMKKEKKNESPKHFNSFGLLIIGTFSITGNDSLKDDRIVQVALFQRSSYVVCSLIEKEFVMNSYASNVMTNLIHTGVPTNMFLCDCTTEQKEDVSLCCQL